MLLDLSSHLDVLMGGSSVEQDGHPHSEVFKRSNISRAILDVLKEDFSSWPNSLDKVAPKRFKSPKNIKEGCPELFIIFYSGSFQVMFNRIEG